MGLDGLSVKNLMLNQSNTSKENAIIADSLANSKTAFSRSVDQLEGKQSIDSQDRENPSFSGGETDVDSEEINVDIEEVDVLEADSLQSEDVVLMDEEAVVSSEVNIQEEIKKLTPQELSGLISHLSQVSGVLVNKKV